MFRIIIAGSRGFCDYSLLKRKLDVFLRNKDRCEIIVLCGEARGADALGKRYAIENGLQFRSFPADWDRHGKRAGYIRNIDMADNADALVAFWDGKSRGTADMIRLARERGMPIRVVYYPVDVDVPPKETEPFCPFYPAYCNAAYSDRCYYCEQARDGFLCDEDSLIM